eukprot:6421726-Amphidinium_carterae.1
MSRKPSTLFGICHSSIVDMLQHHQAAPWLQLAVLQSLVGKHALMRTPAGYVQFDLQTRVQQGRPDSPELFNRTVGYALRQCSPPTSFTWTTS